MNPVKGWKMAASFVFVALVAVLFGYSGRGPAHELSNEPAGIALPARVAPAQAEPPSNEIGDLQQLD